MYSITCVRGHKIVYFKDVEFNITKGITAVQGRNLNRKQKSAANATGKSLLCGMIAEVLMDVPPAMVRNARAARKDIFTAKDSWAEVDLVRGNHLYRVRRTATTLTVFKDGKDLNLRTLQLAREFVSKLISNRTEEEYFAFEYIDSGRPSTFLFGTAAQRFQFFTDLFRLNDIDEIRKWLTKQATELKQNDALVQRLRTELEELGEPTDVKSLKLKRKSLEADHASMFERQRELAKQIQGARVGALYREAAKALTAALDAAGLSKSSEALKELKSVESRIEQASQQQEALAEYRETARKVKQLESEIAELDVPKAMLAKSPSWLSAKADAAAAALTKLDEVSEPDGENVIDREAYKKLKPTIKGLRSDDVKQALTKADALLSQAEEEREEFLSHFRKHDEDAKCPTCFSKISARALKLVKANLDKQVRTAQAKVDKCRDQLKAIRSCLDYEQFEEQRDVYEHAQERADKIRKRYPVKSMRRRAALLKELDAAQQRLLKKRVKGPELDVKELHKRRRVLEAVAHAAAAVRKFPEDAADHADADLDALTSEDKAISERLVQISDRMLKLAVKISSIEQAEEKRCALEKELNELCGGLEDLPVYEALARAYSKSGVKLFLINKIAKMIEANLNHYSKLLYAEPYTFEFNVAHNRFDALVIRNAGGRKLVSDVRRLSGMERRTFSVLWLLALLPLIPKSRRSNLLILDEPEANMDPGMVEPFRDVLLPELNKLIPSIVIATPFDSLVTSKTRIVTAVKKGGVSTLVEGKVE